MLYIRKLLGSVMAKGKGPHSSQIQLHLLNFNSFVEYETAADLKTAVEKIDGREFKGETVRCLEDVSLQVLGKVFLLLMPSDPTRTPPRSLPLSVSTPCPSRIWPTRRVR